jgi:transposase-like protein
VYRKPPPILGFTPIRSIVGSNNIGERSEDAFPGKGRQASDAELVKQLQRENQRLRMERDILKKAMVICSKGPK